MPQTLRIHSFIRRSSVNGPGERFVLWVQGCTLGCPGCFNPDTHTTEGGQTVSVDAMADEILSVDGIEGLTLTGGEPFQQPDPLADLCQKIREAGLSVFIFSGYTLKEIRQAEDLAMQELLGLTDILVAGRFVQTSKSNLLWRGSDNQQVHFMTNRYSSSYFKLDCSPGQVEVTIDPSGMVSLTGFPDEELRFDIPPESGADAK